MVRFQGPKANGMPELHKLTPALGVLQDKGFMVALRHRRADVGRLGQGPGRDPPDARGRRWRPDRQGPRGRHHPHRRPQPAALDALVDETEWAVREPEMIDLSHYHTGLGRELFASFRAAVGPADEGAAAVGRLLAA